MNTANAHHILANFIDSSDIQAVSPLGNGHINSTFKVDLEDNTAYVLQSINTTIFPKPEDIMHNMNVVASHLKKANYPHEILEAIPTKQGTFLYENEDGKVWRLLPFFENTIALEIAKTTAEAYSAAKAFGAYLRYLKDLEVSKLKVIIPQFHDVNMRLKQFENALQNGNPNRINPALLDIQFIINQVPFLEKMSALKLPVRVTHNDTKINNILFDKTTNQPKMIIDLDTLMPGTILSDFGDMVRTFCTNAAEDEADLSKVIFRKEIYQSIEDGFLSELKNNLQSLEYQNLMNGAKQIILVQAMRFLTDYLQNDRYYKTNYAEQNLVRARNQLHLFKQL